MNYTTVIFDMDGVLIDSENVYYSWLRKFLKRNKMQVDEDRLIAINGMSIAESEILLNTLCEPYTKGERNVWNEFISDHVEVDVSYKELEIPGVRELLIFLKEKGIKIGLASSSTKHKICEALEDLCIDEYFPVVLSGEDFKESKPNPEIYLKACELLGSLPQETIVIEDSWYGIEAGRRAGCYVIAREEKRLGFDQSSADAIGKDMYHIKEMIARMLE